MSRGSWSFLAHRVAEAHLQLWFSPLCNLKFLKNIHPWVLFQQWRPEAYLRQAPQARCGPKWTISRSEQYPEGPYMYSPWSLFNICGRGEHLLNKFDYVIETPGQRLWVIRFELSCIDLWGPALFNIQMQDFLIKHVICTPGHDFFRDGFLNNRLECLIIFGIQGCFICRYFVSGPKPLQSF